VIKIINSNLEIKINRAQEELEVLCRLKREVQEKLKKLYDKKGSKLNERTNSKNYN